MKLLSSACRAPGNQQFAMLKHWLETIQPRYEEKQVLDPSRHTRHVTRYADYLPYLNDGVSSKLEFQELVPLNVRHAFTQRKIEVPTNSRPLNMQQGSWQGCAAVRVSDSSMRTSNCSKSNLEICKPGPRMLTTATPNILIGCIYPVPSVHTVPGRSADWKKILYVASLDPVPQLHLHVNNSSRQ